VRITLLGAGSVASALARRLIDCGHAVDVWVRDPGSAKAGSLREAVPEARLVDGDAIRPDSILFLATPFAAHAAVLRSLGDLHGAILVDCTNPVGPGLTHALGDRAGAVAVQAAAPTARVVKAFNTYGFEVLGDPGFGGGRPALFLAGDDADACDTVAALASSLGWDPVRAGGLEAALDVEHLALLWIRMVRVQGASSRLAWSQISD